MPAFEPIGFWFFPPKILRYLAGLSLNPDQQTRENLLINKAIYYSNNNQFAEAIEILGKLIIDSKTTIGNREGAKFVLSNITGINN